MLYLMNVLTRYFETVPDWLRKWKYYAWTFFVLATVFFFYGATRAVFDTSIEGWFKKDDPTIVSLDWYHHEFGSDDHLYIAYKPKDGNVFSAQSLSALQKLHRELQQQAFTSPERDKTAFKHITKITSLINAPVLRAQDGALISQKLIGDETDIASLDTKAVPLIAESQPAFPLLYFSKDYQYGGILVETDFGAIPLTPVEMKDKTDVIELQFDDAAMTVGSQERPRFQPTDLADYINLMNQMKTILEKPEYADYFEFYPVGSTAAGEYNLAMISEMGMLNLVALAIIIILLGYFFRSFCAVLWPVIIVILTAIWTVGITAWLGLPVTAFVMVAIMLALAIGIADTVHMLSAYLSCRREGLNHRSALRRGFHNVATACLLTTVTNIVAVIALSLTPIVPIQIFSMMCVLAVGLPFFFLIYLLPLLLDIAAPDPVKLDKRGRISQALARVFPDFSCHLRKFLAGVLPMVEKRPVKIIVLFGTVLAICIYGAMQTKVNTDPTGSFPEESKIRRSVSVVDKNMMGAQSMEVYIDLGQENAFHDPVVLHEIDKLQNIIKSRYSDVVVRATSLVDTVKDSYQKLNENSPDKFIIPATRADVSQTLFLFNQSNPDDRKKLVSDNYDRSHISIRLYNKGSYEYIQAWESMQQDINRTVAVIKQHYPEATFSITGMLPLMMQGADYMTESELEQFCAAILFVSIIFFFLFGSGKGGMIALVPNLIPAILAYGALGLLDRPLDITTMMIAPIIIGIAVDDTVHFVTHYRNQVMIDGDIRRALNSVITEAGQSVVFTTLILGIGFGVMAFASDSGTANLGMFGSLAIFVGMLNDLFLLPALILVFKLKFSGNNGKPSTDQAPA